MNVQAFEGVVGGRWSGVARCQSFAFAAELSVNCFRTVTWQVHCVDGYAGAVQWIPYAAQLIVVQIMTKTLDFPNSN